MFLSEMGYSELVQRLFEIMTFFLVDHQTKVGVGNGGGVKKDAQPGRSVWGGAAFLLWLLN
jgi:hypothetical protein